MFQAHSFQLLINSIPLLLQSAVTTVEIALAAISIGVFFGVFLGILNCHKLSLKWPSLAIDTFVWMVRGTPLFVQLLIIYYALPELIGVSFSPFVAGVITLGINSSAYVSEIIRAGIDAIPEGQWEASYVMGYTKFQTLQGIVLPQMFRHVLPALTNELTSLIKETSILMVIGVAELTKASKDIVARELDPLTIYLASAFLYLLMTTTISFATKKIQRRLEHD